MKTKKAKMWLVRYRRTGLYPMGWYGLGENKPVFRWGEWLDITGRLHDYAPRPFHRLTGIRLKPGEGPVRVEVSVRLLSKRRTK